MRNIGNMCFLKELFKSSAGITLLFDPYFQINIRHTLHLCRLNDMNEDFNSKTDS